MKEFYFLTNTQIRDMKKCIGFESDQVTGMKYRKFTAKRNIYLTNKDHEYWNKLCSQGLAEKSSNSKGDNADAKIYKLSVDGIQLLEQILEIKIEVDVQTTWKSPKQAEQNKQ